MQTSAPAEIGSRVTVTLQRRDGATIEVGTVVMNRRSIPRRLVSVAHGGIGCRIDAAPEAYYRLLAEISPAP